MANETPSIGGGIALQYKMPQNNFAAQAIMQQRAEENRAIAAARKAHAETLARIDKYQGDLGKFNVEGIIAPLQKPVQADVAELYNHLKQKKAENENYNPFQDDELREKKFRVEQNLSNARVQSKAYLDDVQRAVDHPDQFDIDEDFTNAVGTGNFDKWSQANSKMHAGETNGTNIYTHGVLKPKAKEPELPKLLGAFSSWAGQQQKLTTQEGAQFTPERVKTESWETFKEASPEWRATVANWTAKNGSNGEAMAEEYFKPKYLNLFDVKAAPEKKEEDGGLTAVDIKENVPVNIFDATKGQNIADKANYGLALPSNVTINLANAEGVVSRDTGKQLVGADDKPFVGQLNITGGEIYSTKFQEAGTKKVKYVPMLYTTATVPMPDGKSVTKNVQIPLDKIKDQKVLAKHKEAIDEIQKKTEALNQKKVATKKTLSKAELTKKAKDAGYTYDEYYEIVKDKIEVR